jgi:hypothetical protein
MSQATHRVVLYGWKVSLDRMDLTQLLHLRCSLALDQASALVESLLDDRKVTLEFSRETQARQFADDATRLGALCNVESAQGFTSEPGQGE